MRKNPAVIMDGEDDEATNAWRWGHEADARSVSTRAQMIAALGEWIEQGREVLAVQGGDAFLGEVLTCVMRHYSGASGSLRLFALPATRERSQVAALLGDGSTMEKRARYLLKSFKKGRLGRTQISTLRLSNSTDEAPRYGFNFAAGLFYELELIRRRGGVSGATQLASLGVEAAQRARGHDADAHSMAGVVARERRDVRPISRGVLCGALPRGLFDISLSHKGGARMLEVEREADALALMARAKAPVAALRGEAGEPFGVIHLDRLEHYSLDGRDGEVTAGSIVQLTPGPDVMMWS